MRLNVRSSVQSQLASQKSCVTQNAAPPFDLQGQTSRKSRFQFLQEELPETVLTRADQDREIYSTVPHQKPLGPTQVECFHPQLDAHEHPEGSSLYHCRFLAIARW